MAKIRRRKLERYNSFIIQHIDNKTKFAEKILPTSFLFLHSLVKMLKFTSIVGYTLCGPTYIERFLTIFGQCISLLNYNCCYACARENEVRERIPHTCPSSYENFFQSIFVSASCGVAILMSTCYWSVRVTSFNFKLCGGLSGKSSERRLFKKSRSFSRVLIVNEPRYISKLEK